MKYFSIALVLCFLYFFSTLKAQTSLNNIAVLNPDPHGILELAGLSGVAKLIVDGEGIEIKDSLQLPAGRHKIKLIAVSGYEGKTINTTIHAGKKTTINASLEKKTSGKALLKSIIVPGLGQAYQEKHTRGWLYPALFVTGVAGSFAILNSYNTAVDDYNSIRDQYAAAYSNDKINSLREEMYKAYDRVESKENIRDLVFITTGIVWLVNAFDTILLPPKFKKNISISIKSTPNKIVLCHSFPLR